MPPLFAIIDRKAALQVAHSPSDSLRQRAQPPCRFPHFSRSFESPATSSVSSGESFVPDGATRLFSFAGGSHRETRKATVIDRCRDAGSDASDGRRVHGRVRLLAARWRRHRASRHEFHRGSSEDTVFTPFIIVQLNFAVSAGPHGRVSLCTEQEMAE